MTGVSARSEAVPARAEGRVRLAPGRTQDTRAVWLIIGLGTALGLALRLYQLSRPNYLFGVTGYDDGVDFSSAVRLVSGELPYRDFVLVQPPGITLLMAPLGLLAKAAGTDVAFAAARIAMACVGAAGVLFAGVLV